MHLKTTLLAPVALGAVVGASRNVRDVDPCAQITSLVADSNEKDGTSYLGGGEDRWLYRSERRALANGFS